MALTGEQKRKLSDALIAAYPTYPDLQLMLSFRLDKTLPNISQVQAMPLVVFQVIVDAEARGWTAPLIAKAVEANPGNLELGAVAQELEMTALPRALERTINERAAFIDVGTLLANLNQTVNQVCRVEVPTQGGTIYGTGFLVGPDAVLTNYHVVEAVIKGQAKPADVVLRFDYRTIGGGRVINPGTEFKLAANWLLDHSEIDPLDLVESPADSTPDPNRLDYALLRLKSPAGNQPAGGRGEPGAAPRGTITLPVKAPVINEKTIVFIVQHPDGDPIRLAVETSAKTTVNGNSTRVRHRTNTAGGSSGSPCFDQDWNVLALHHTGDPNFTQLAKYNQGVLLHAIRQRITQKGAGAALS